MQSQSENKMEKLLDCLLNAYASYFDVCRDEEMFGERIPALAQFHSRSEQYVLIKKATLWAAESHEYLFFFLEPDITANRLLKISQLLTQAEKELVKPHNEHMYTYISGIILAEGISMPLSSLIRKIKFRKNYKFSFHGWCHLRLALIDTTDNRVCTNHDGKEMKKILKKLLQ